jgi:hypothetical protein
MIDDERHAHGPGCGHPGTAVDAPSVQRRSSVSDAVRSPGRPLEPPLREQAEEAFGMRLDDVRVHNGPVAQRSARDLGARAYTTGHHIVVGSQGVDDETMFHELDHVRQQSLGSVAGTDNGAGTKVSHPDDPFERQAAANGRKMAQGAAPDLSVPKSAGHGGAVQRSPVVTRGTGSYDYQPLGARGGTAATGIAFIDNYVVPHRDRRTRVSNPWLSNFAVLMYRDNSTGAVEVVSSFNTGNLGPHSEEVLIGHLNNQRVDFEPLALFTDRVPCQKCLADVVGPTISGRGSKTTPVPVYYITDDRDQGDIRSWWA